MRPPQGNWLLGIDLAEAKKGAFLFHHGPRKSDEDMCSCGGVLFGELKENASAKLVQAAQYIVA